MMETPGQFNWHDMPDLQVANGAFGVVWKVKWRGDDVALKEIRLPQGRRDARGGRRVELQSKLQAITSGFVKEVQIAAKAAHPNLVRLLGYATRPRLLLVQELMRGQSLDKQLYRPRVISMLIESLDWLRFTYVLRCLCGYLRHCGAGTTSAGVRRRSSCSRSPSTCARV
jgi:serine/threonine protein kinase